MAWTFRCPCGEERGVLRSTEKPKSDGYDCDKTEHEGGCGADRSKGDWVQFDERVSPAFMGNLKPEIQPHFNESLGVHVEGRKHLEHLQLKHGVSDYSPSAARPVPSNWR